MSSRRAAFAATIAPGILSAVIPLWASASSSSLPLHLSWVAPEGCPSVAAVRAAVGAMVGADAPQESRPDLVADGVVTGEPGHFTLHTHVTLDGVTEVKTLGADGCAALADAYALIVAFALDPSAGPRAEPPAPTTLEAAAPNDPGARGPSTERSPASGPVVVAPGPSERHAELAIGPFVALSVGLLPAAAAGVGGRLALEKGLRWELASTYWPEQSASATASPSRIVGARVGLFSVGPAVCGSIWRGVSSVCLGAEAGAMHATGTAVPTSRTGTSFWLVPTSSITARLQLSRAVDLRFRLDVGLPIFRPTFAVDHVGVDGSSVDVYRPPPVYGAISLQPELRFFHGSGR